MATVTAVELDSVSYKLVSIAGTLLLSGSVQALWCSCYGLYTHKTVLTGSWRKVIPKVYFISEDKVPLVLARRYRAHATASHVQDCPGLGP